MATKVGVETVFSYEARRAFVIARDLSSRRPFRICRPHNPFLDSLWHGDRLGQEMVMTTPKSYGWGRKVKITTALIDIYDGDLNLDGSASFSLENAISNRLEA
jgi:hypothetical protein